MGYLRPATDPNLLNMPGGGGVSGLLFEFLSDPRVPGSNDVVIGPNFLSVPKGACSSHLMKLKTSHFVSLINIYIRNRLTFRFSLELIL